jgi:hypothetical protein
MINNSAAMAKNLVDAIHVMIYVVKQLGPSPVNKKIGIGH